MPSPLRMVSLFSFDGDTRIDGFRFRQAARSHALGVADSCPRRRMASERAARRQTKKPVALERCRSGDGLFVCFGYAVGPVVPVCAAASSASWRRIYFLRTSMEQVKWMIAVIVQETG